MSGQYNLRNPAVKRLMKEAQELREPTEQYFAQPLEDNLFEWHFTIRGPIDSEFDGGIYHGRIILPPEYPMKPPSIMLLTPNGRFETYKKICLSISGHHPESWQPSWSIRTALLAIIGFMPTHGNGAIGSLDYTPEERKVLSKRSMEWKCPECGSIKSMLKPVTEASKKTTEEAKELASQINFQGEKEKNGSKKEGDEAKASTESSGAEGAATATTSPPTGPDGAGAAGPASPTPGLPPFAQQMFPPSFPGMMPPNMPPFMPRMMAPPRGAGAVPPFMRPFMMPPMPAGGGGTVPPGGMYRWPAMYHPMMNPQMMNPQMMNPQMMAMMSQQMSQQMGQQQANPQAAPTMVPAPAPAPAAAPTPTVSSPAASAAPTSPTSVTSSTVTSTSTSSQSATPRSSSTSSPTVTTSSSSSSPPTPSSNPAPSSSSSSSASPTPSQTPITTPPSPQATSSSSAEGLRQRRTEGQTALSGPSAQPTPAPTPAPAVADLAPPSQRRGENPVVVMVMALLGLLIIVLILRRLYNVVNAGAFDNDF